MLNFPFAGPGGSRESASVARAPECPRPRPSRQLLIQLPSGALARHSQLLLTSNPARSPLLVHTHARTYTRERPEREFQCVRFEGEIIQASAPRRGASGYTSCGSLLCLPPHCLCYLKREESIRLHVRTVRPKVLMNKMLGVTLERVRRGGDCAAPGRATRTKDRRALSSRIETG